MKRAEAFRKLRSICRQLDTADPDELYYAPEALYLHGSVLTAHPHPADIDLLLVVRFLVPLEKAYDEIMTGAIHRHFIAHIRQRMKHINISEGGSLSSCKNFIVCAEGAPVKRIWQPGLDWDAILTSLESHPLPGAGPTPEERAAYIARWESYTPEERSTLLEQAAARIE